MSFKNIFIMAAVLILCVSGISAQASETAAGTQASEELAGTQAGRAAQAAVKGGARAQQTVYTPQDLCSMAKYYYKKTAGSGFYPPEAVCTEESDGTYTINLRERVEDGHGEFHYASYASYNVDSTGKGQETTLGNPVDFTVYSKVYTPERLCRLAQDYYYRMNDFYPPNATYTANADGTYTICLYEVIKDNGSSEHSATCGWFTVDVCGIGQDDIMLQAIDINP